MKNILILIISFLSFNLLAQDHSIEISLADNNNISGKVYTAKVIDILSWKTIKYFDGEKDVNLPLNEVKAFIIDSTRSFELVIIKGNRYIAQLLVDGSISLYKVMPTEVLEEFYIYKDGENEFVKLTKTNRAALYNLYFKDCNEFSEENLFKLKGKFSEDQLINHFQKYYACLGESTTAHTKKQYNKTDLYIHAGGGLQYFKPTFIDEYNTFYQANHTSQLNYYINTELIAKVKPIISVSFLLGFESKTALLEKQKTLAFTNSIDSISGQVNINQVSLGSNLRVYFTKKAFQPYFLAGLRFGIRPTSETFYTFKNRYYNVYNEETLDNIDQFSIGFGTGLGMQYTIRNKAYLGVDAGIKYDISNFGYSAGGINEFSYCFGINLGFKIATTHAKKD
ncbi:MAG: hypothetical protein K1X55_09375 [Chitinophagales bacterium]|nr:hypothetical protein [Chitinophagales bacterium]